MLLLICFLIIYTFFLLRSSSKFCFKYCDKYFNEYIMKLISNALKPLSIAMACVVIKGSYQKTTKHCP